MPKPTSIRIAQGLVYVKLALSLISLVLNVAILTSPSLQARNKVNIADWTFGQFTMAMVSLVIPVAAAVLTLIFMGRKKRIPAIMSSLVILFVSTNNYLQMALGAFILIMLFSRSAKAYFDHKVPAETESMPDSPAEDEASATDETRPVPRVKSDPVIVMRPAGANDAATIHTLMMEAFEEYRASVPPSSALDETLESVRNALEAGQAAAILYEDELPVAMVRYEMQDDAIYFFRLSVIPSRRRRGYSKRLVRWIEQQGRSKGLSISRCKVRQTVQNNVAMYQDMGYEIVDQELVVRPAGSVKALTMEKNLLM